MTTEDRKRVALTQLAAPSVLAIKDDIVSSLLLASATKATGTWTATVRLNCGGAIEVRVGCEQQIKVIGERHKHTDSHDDVDNT